MECEKMKKLLSGLLTVVMFVSIITSVTLFSIRGMISSNNIEKMYDTFAEEGVIEELIGFDSSEFEEVLDDKEYKKMLDIVNQKNSFLENIFSLKKKFKRGVKYRVITILGLKFERKVI